MFPCQRRESISITNVKIDNLTQFRADGQPAPAIGGTDYTSQSFHICWYIHVCNPCVRIHVYPL